MQTQAYTLLQAQCNASIMAIASLPLRLWLVIRPVVVVVAHNAAVLLLLSLQCCVQCLLSSTEMATVQPAPSALPHFFPQHIKSHMDRVPYIQYDDIPHRL